MENFDEYQKQRNNAQDFYNSINSVFSPVLELKIAFSAEGFNHLIFKNARSEREKSSQLLRFKLLPLAKKLVELSTTYQEYKEITGEFIFKKHKKNKRKPDGKILGANRYHKRTKNKSYFKKSW